MHDIGVFVMQVEQVDLVRQFGPIKAAFFGHNHVKAMRIAIDRGSAHAARCAFTENDDRVDIQLREMCDQRCSKKRAGALLKKDRIAFDRPHFRTDRIDVSADRHFLPVGCVHHGRLGRLAGFCR